jgi:hypothetical protein
MALEAVQAQAGHARIESTQIYLHLADDWLAGQYRRAAERSTRRSSPAIRPGVAGGVHGEWAAAAAGLGRARRGAARVVDTMRRYLEQIGCICGRAA